MGSIGTVMLIDDEEIDQKSYQRILTRTGMVEQIISFTYAEEALQFLKDNPDVTVDVIFLDINMPRMNGFEFLDAARAQIGDYFARMVVVMLSTSMHKADQDRAQDHPSVQAFFDKPLTVEHVKRAILLLEQQKEGLAT